jgi:hypothetical protein
MNPWCGYGSEISVWQLPLRALFRHSSAPLLMSGLRRQQNDVLTAFSVFSSIAMSTAFRSLLLPYFPKLAEGVGTWCVPCGFTRNSEGQPTTKPVTAFGAQSDSAVWKKHLSSKHKELLESLVVKHSGKRSAAAAAAAAATSASSSDVASVADLTEEPQPKRAKIGLGANSSATSTASSARNGSVIFNPITTLFAKRGQAAILGAFVRWLAVSSIAHNAAESDECRDFLLTMGWTGALPSRNTLRVERARQAEELRDILGSKLAHRVVTLACDSWTNVQHSKVTNVVVIVDAQAFYWCSIVNAEERNTAEWMAARLLPIIQKLTREWDARIAGFAVDNEAVNFSCLKLLRNELPPLLHVPCAAHTLQLVVRSCLEHETFAGTTEQLTSLIRHFDAKEHRVALLQLQRARDVKQLRIIKPCDTRWNSMLASAKRMMQLRAEVRCCFTPATLPSVAADFWERLQAFIDFLEPFRVATDAVQSDAATLLTVYEQFVLLQKHVREHHQWAADSIMSRWNKHINVPAVTACALLSFVQLPPALSQARAQQFILNWGTSYLHFYHLAPEGDSRRDIRDTLTEQLADFHGRLGGFALLDDIRQSLQRRADAANPFCAKKVWLLHSELELSKVAVALLSLSPSEAAVERSFSAQGSVHTSLRNRMGDSSVQDEMFIKFNSRPLRASTTTAPPPPVSKIVELSPEADEVEANSDSEDAFLFAPRRNNTAASARASAAAADAAAMDEDAVTEVEDDTGERRAAGVAAEEQEELVQEDSEESTADAAVPSAPSGAAARRAARRAVSIIFKDVDTFLAWFIRTRHLSSSSVINADVHNDLQQNSQSKLPIANAPSTKELCNRIRALLQQKPSGAAAAAAAECT